MHNRKRDQSLFYKNKRSNHYYLYQHVYGGGGRAVTHTASEENTTRNNAESHLQPTLVLRPSSTSSVRLC